MPPEYGLGLEGILPVDKEVKMAKSLVILICGAGIAGLGAAIALRRKGHQVVMVEAASHLQEIGAGLHIPPNSSRILKSWGLEPRLAGKVVSPRSMQFRRYETGELLGRHERNPYMQDKYGSPYWMIHRADYQKVLHDEALELGVQLLLGARIESVDEKGPCVLLHNGRRLAADLVVGADGIRSRTRTSILKESADAVEAPECAFRATVPVDLINAEPLISHLMSDINGSVWLGPGKHIVGYPIQNGELYNLVLMYPDRGWVGTWDEPADVEEMRSHYKNWEPIVPKLLDQVESCTKWTLAHLPPLESWVSESGQVVLIGDAAHAMLPYMAQGAAVSIEDGAALAECLDRVNEIVDIPASLRAFQNFRKPRCETISKAALSNANIFHLQDGPEQEKRDRKLKREMKSVDAEPTDGERSTTKLSDQNFQAWLYGYDTVKEINIFLDSHLTRKVIGESFASRALVQGGFLTI